MVQRIGSPVTISPAGGTGVGTATASCNPGETIIGGGFRVTGIDVNQDTAYPTENYPSSTTTWRTTEVIYGSSGLSGTLTVYAICATS